MQCDRHLRDTFRQASRSVYTSTVVVSPDPLPPTPSTSSVMKIHDPQYPGPSASLLETEETPEKTERDPDMPEPAAEGDNKVENSRD